MRHGSSYSSPIDQLRNINTSSHYNSTVRTAHVSQPKVQTATTSSPRVLTSNSTFNLDDYEKVERDGVVIYRKRAAAELPQ